jgi:lipid-binding SYLF domain-containing protein
MKRFGLMCLCLTFGVVAAKAATPAEQLQKATNVMNEIMKTPDQGIPSNLLAKAVCVGIVPSELKFAIGVGGSYGRGVLVCRKGGDGPWGAPSMFTLGGGSFGFQLGGQATDVVFIVMNESGARKLVRDNVKLGADISAAAGPVGRAGQAATDAELHAEILSYSRNRGLFAGVSLSGAILKQDNSDNEKLYGRHVTAKQILFEGVTRPASARELDATLARYSPRGGHPFTHQA